VPHFSIASSWYPPSGRAGETAPAVLPFFVTPGPGDQCAKHPRRVLALVIRSVYTAKRVEESVMAQIDSNAEKQLKTTYVKSPRLICFAALLGFSVRGDGKTKSGHD
jgi:hypothetical protein